MFLRILHVLSLLILIASAVVVYKVKYDTTYEVQRIAKLRSEIRSENERLALLRAEWTRLAAPQRVQELATRHLNMKPLDVVQVRDFSNLPEKPFKADDADMIGEFIDTLAGDGPRDPLGDFLRTLNTPGKPAAERKP